MKTKTKTPIKFGLDCDYYKGTFDTVQELLDNVLSSGMDPNYNITENGVDSGQCLADLIQY